MQTRLIIRLLAADGSLLGWTEISALARGDGRLWALEPVQLGVEQAGTPAQVSAHWVDVNVETRVTLTEHRQLSVGEVVTVSPAGPILIVGPMPGALPPVTVRAPVKVAVPAGGMGLVGNR